MNELKTKGYFTNEYGIKSTETIKSGAYAFMQKYYSFMPRKPLPAVKHFSIENSRLLKIKRGITYHEGEQLSLNIWAEMNE